MSAPTPNTVIVFPGQPLVAIHEAHPGEWQVILLKPGTLHPEVQVVFRCRMEALLDARKGAHLMGWRFIGRYAGGAHNVHA